LTSTRLGAAYISVRITRLDYRLLECQGFDECRASGEDES